MTTLELQAEKKLKDKLYLIDVKFSKEAIKSSEMLVEKRTKAIAKAERQVKQRLINKEKQAKNKARAKEGKPLLKVKKKKPVNHMAKADWYFSRCIRSMGAWQGDDGERYNTEYTGSANFRIKDLTCGHYETRGIYSTRYHIWNCLPQTAGQNKAEHHNPSLKKIFRKRLLAKYGERAVQEVEELAKVRTKNENAKTDMEYEHEKRKKEYERYKHMRE